MRVTCRVTYFWLLSAFGIIPFVAINSATWHVATAPAIHVCPRALPIQQRLVYLSHRIELSRRCGLFCLRKVPSKYPSLGLLLPPSTLDRLAQSRTQHLQVRTALHLSSKASTASIATHMTFPEPFPGPRGWIESFQAIAWLTRALCFRSHLP